MFMAKLKPSKNALKVIIQTELELFTINIQLSHHAKMGFILRH
ncbi:hypothetical protein RGC42_03075 [Helicobacter pylori]|nr:hypothetical protein [Helicobacter pylori]